MAIGVCPRCKEPVSRADGVCELCETLGLASPTQPEAVSPAMAAPSVDTDPPPPALSSGVSAHSEPEDAEEPADETVVRLEDEDDAGAPPTPPDPDTLARKTEEATFFRRLASIQEDKKFAILFLGFRAAGKTWLLHRMKEQLFSQDGVGCEPKYRPVKPRRGDREELPGTTKIEFHEVMTAPSFMLIDINGESTQDLVEASFADLRMLLAAMRYAKAMIIALPTDFMIFGPLLPNEDAEVLEAAADGGTLDESQEARLRAWAEAFREGSDQLDDFTEGLFRIAGILSYLRYHDIDPADEEAYAKVTLEAVTRHMGRPNERTPVGGPAGLDCPTFFALTKADRVMPVFFKTTDPVREKRDREILARPETRVFKALAQEASNYYAKLPLSDPWEAVRWVRKNLHTQLITYFPLAKFDYATAFYGHDGGLTMARDHYDKHPQHGVYEVLEWISDARGLGRLPAAFRWPYAVAAWARRYIAGVRKPRNLSFWQEGDK